MAKPLNGWNMSVTSNIKLEINLNNEEIF